MAALDDVVAQPQAELSVAQLVKKAAAETRKRCVLGTGVRAAPLQVVSRSPVAHSPFPTCARPAGESAAKPAKAKAQKQRKSEPQELKPAWTARSRAFPHLFPTWSHRFRLKQVPPRIQLLRLPLRHPANAGRGRCRDHGACRVREPPAKAQGD